MDATTAQIQLDGIAYKELMALPFKKLKKDVNERAVKVKTPIINFFKNTRDSFSNFFNSNFSVEGLEQRIEEKQAEIKENEVRTIEEAQKAIEDEFVTVFEVYKEHDSIHKKLRRAQKARSIQLNATRRVVIGTPAFLNKLKKSFIANFTYQDLEEEKVNEIEVPNMENEIPINEIEVPVNLEVPNLEDFLKNNIEEPTVEEPVKEEPTVEEPVKEEPTIEEPVKEEPTIEEPVKEESTVEEPVKEEPTVEEKSPKATFEELLSSFDRMIAENDELKKENTKLKTQVSKAEEVVNKTQDENQKLKDENRSFKLENKGLKEDLVLANVEKEQAMEKTSRIEASYEEKLLKQEEMFNKKMEEQEQRLQMQLSSMLEAMHSRLNKVNQIETNERTK